MVLRPCIVILLLALSAWGAQAQDFWKRLRGDAEFATRFDNREYRSEFSDSKTLFSSKFRGLAIYNFETQHRLVAGGDLIRHMGAQSARENPDPELILFYDYSDVRLSASVGAFPRLSIAAYPREFISGTNTFYDDVIEGVRLGYRNSDYWNVEFAGDWYGKKSETEREQFMLYSSGIIDVRRGLSAGYYATVQHFSESETAQGVVDNMLLKPWVGYNRPNWGGSVAWVQSLQRDRLHEDKWALPRGFWASARMNWRSLTVDDQLYLGDDLMPYWSRYGSELYKGDPFFRTTHGVYNRLEFRWQPRISDAVKLGISSVHHYDGKTWSWQQTATLSVRLNPRTLK
jgi:hypothetical protein